MREGGQIEEQVAQVYQIQERELGKYVVLEIARPELRLNKAPFTLCDVLRNFRQFRFIIAKVKIFLFPPPEHLKVWCKDPRCFLSMGSHLVYGSMPSIAIDFTRLNEPIETKDGLIILEIQGELNLPSARSDQELYTKDGHHDAITFGKLELQGKEAVLYVGKSQRLIGKVVTLDPPLGLLKFPAQDPSLEDGQSFKGEAKVILTDIIEKKIIFSHRPLPIM